MPTEPEKTDSYCRALRWAASECERIRDQHTHPLYREALEDMAAHFREEADDAAEGVV